MRIKTVSIRTHATRWIALGLAAAGAGFLGASLNPGAGPRTVKGSSTLGPFYLPPLLVALSCAVVAAAAARGSRRWLAGVTGLVALALLIGSATTGSAAISYRISHPGHPLGFVEDWLQLLGEGVATVAAALAVFYPAGHHARF